jgi:uncharacterized protein (TIGR02757 family)
MEQEALSKYLLEKAAEFNTIDFIENDPISIPHIFHRREDIEISALFTALISWGRRDIIIRNAKELVDRMDRAPYAFVMEGSKSDWNQLQGFVHRTFQGADAITLTEGLKDIYSRSGLEQAFKVMDNEQDTQNAIVRFRNLILMRDHEARFRKHLANPDKGSAAKRIHMFLRWMAREDDRNVDFGLWKSIPMQKLMIPLDVHSGRIARQFGLLRRKQNDRRAVEELTSSAKTISPNDPALIDYALFGLGLEESR